MAKTNLYVGTMTRFEALAKLARLAERIGIPKSAIKVRRVEGSPVGMRLSFAVGGVTVERTCSSQATLDANFCCLTLWLADRVRNLQRRIETFDEAFHGDASRQLGGDSYASTTAAAYEGSRSVDDALEIMASAFRRLGISSSAYRVTWGEQGSEARVRVRLPSGRMMEKASHYQADARRNLGALALWLQTRAKNYERGIEPELEQLFAAYLLAPGA